MKKVEVAAFPGCAYCDKKARFDDKVIGTSWAYLCERHQKEMGAGVGYELVAEGSIVKIRSNREINGLTEELARAVLTDLLGDDTDAIETELSDWGF